MKLDCAVSVSARLRSFLALGVAAILLMVSTPALAWGWTGHRTVCEIAFRNLTPAAKAEVTRLLQARPQPLAGDQRNAEFGWACTYPDRPVDGGPGKRDIEHYINFPRYLSDIGPESGCGEAYDCLDTAIVADYARLKSRALPDRLRLAALIYLGHWVGDIHQPLHNSFADDRGGGDIKTSGLCTFGLHSAWDTCILQQRVYANAGEPSIDAVQTVAAAWSGQVSDTDRAQWLSGTPWQWSNESYKITIDPAVHYCVMVQATCQYDANRVTFDGSSPRVVPIDAQYEAFAMPIIQRRITQAGIRLAHVINLALDPAYRPVD